MKNIILLVKSNIKRNRMGILLSVFSGVVLSLLIYLMGQFVGSVALSKIEIGVMDYDKSILSTDFKSYLSEELDYKLVEHESYDYLSELLIDKSISSIIEIPDGFYDMFASGQDGNITITSTDDFENAAFLEAYMNSYLAGVKLLSINAKGDQRAFDRLITEYKEVEIPISKSKAFDMDLEQFRQREGFRNTIGFFLQIMFALGVVLSFMILDDRATGVYNRITVTPVKPVHYIAGNSIFGFILLMIEVVIYCGYIAIKDVDIGFPVYKLFILMLLLSLFITCFLVSASILIKSKSGITVVIMGYSTIGSILGGAYFPIDMSPEVLQNIARILPQFWFMDAVTKLMNNPMTDISSNIIIIVLFTVLAFLVGAVSFSQNNKRG
ncbi:MAG: ABC transporter permease [Herbinix sp.]|nr:ABC transporter permease [Herbinix sp.]